MPNALDSLTDEEISKAYHERRYKLKTATYALDVELKAKFVECVGILKNIRIISPAYTAPWENKYKQVMLFYLMKDYLKEHSRTCTVTEIMATFSSLHGEYNIWRLLKEKSKGDKKVWVYNKDDDRVTLLDHIV